MDGWLRRTFRHLVFDHGPCGGADFFSCFLEGCVVVEEEDLFGGLLAAGYICFVDFDSV